MSESKENLNEVRSVRNNNPGNLRAADAATQKKLTQPGYVLDKAIGFDKDGFAIFPDKETGLSAMQRQIGIDASRGMTGAQMINKYAPREDKTPLGQKYPNDPDVYTRNVFTQSGLDPNKPIDPKNIDTIQRAMIKQEGGQSAYDHFYGDEMGSDQYVAATPSKPTSSTGEVVAAAAVPAVGLAALGSLASRDDISSRDVEAERRPIGTLSQWSDPRQLYSVSRSKLRSRVLDQEKSPVREPQYQPVARAVKTVKQIIRQQRVAKQQRMPKVKRIPMVARLQKVDGKMKRVLVPQKVVAENTVRFKDLREKIYEQIIQNEKED